MLIITTNPDSYQVSKTTWKALYSQSSTTLETDFIQIKEINSRHNIVAWFINSL